MITRLRQKTCTPDKACVLMLCMATAMLLGFSKPHNSMPAKVVDDSIQRFYSGHATVVQGAFAGHNAGLRSVPEKSESPSATAELIEITPPDTSTGEYAWTSLLGGVDTQAWSNESASELAFVTQHDTYSPSGVFHGIGFPDIRTYPQARRSPYAPPGLHVALIIISILSTRMQKSMKSMRNWLKR